MDNIAWGKLSMIGTWLGDSTSLYVFHIFFSLTRARFLVLDMMLQEKKHYQQWAKWLRQKWEGRVRIISFWVYQAVLTPLVISLVVTDAIDWSKAGFGTSGLGRAVCGVILDFLIWR